MITLTFEELARMVGGTVHSTSKAMRSFEGVSIDSRTIRPRELFIAFRGGRVDSHLFVPEVLRKGAAGALVEFHYPGLSSVGPDTTLVAVDDSIAAMKTLARSYREMVKAKVVGITGSNGKTTTKEMTYALLSAVDKDVYRSAGNLNNLFGMPLAIFAMPKATRVAVMEMGISQPGEMTRLVQIVRPDVAVITNIGATHLEFLGSLEGVARAKFEMVASSAPEMPVIINADDPVLAKEIKQYRETYITFGITHSATFEPEHIERDSSSVVIVTIEGRRFRLPLFGEHQVYNLLAGYAIARTLGYNFDHADTMAIPLGTAPMRGQTVVHNDITFVCDCYNANPESVRLGLKSFQLLKAKGRRIIILGDMLELGARGSEYHHDVGGQLARMHFDLAIGVGPLSKAMVDGAVEEGVPAPKLLHFDNAEIAADEVKKLLRPGDTVYIKGSRGIGLERILSEFTKAEVQA